MPITDLLERNSKLYGNEVALVEINPEIREEQRVTWKEYELIQPTSTSYYRREITWSVFDEKANRVANMLLERGISCILISSDLEEILGMCPRVAVMHEGRLAGFLEGDQLTEENIMLLATGTMRNEK